LTKAPVFIKIKVVVNTTTTLEKGCRCEHSND
jgi:hypothetical protein